MSYCLQLGRAALLPRRDPGGVELVDGPLWRHADGTDEDCGLLFDDHVDEPDLPLRFTPCMLFIIAAVQQ